MAIQQLYDSLTPPVFYALVIAVAMLLGFFLGWCLWWWKARSFDQTQELSRKWDLDVDQLRAENEELDNQIRKQKRERSAGGASDDPSGAISPGTDKTDDATDGATVSASGKAAATATAGLATAAVGLAAANLSGAGRSESDPTAAGAVRSDMSDEADRTIANGDSDAIAAELQLPGEVGDPIDWNRVAGLPPEVTAELNRLGVDHVDKIDSLTPSDRQSLESTLAATATDQNSGQAVDLPSLKNLLAIGGVAAVGASAVGASAVAAVENRAEANAEISLESGSGGASEAAEPVADAGTSSVKADSGGSVGRDSSVNVDETGTEACAADHSPATASGSVASDISASDVAASDVAVGVVSAIAVSTDASDAHAEASWFASSFLPPRSLQIPPHADCLAVAPSAVESRPGDQDANRSVGHATETQSAETQSASRLADRNSDQVTSEDAHADSVGPTDWTRFDGVDGMMANELDRLGVTHPSQLASLSGDDFRRIEQHLSDRGINADLHRIADQAGVRSETFGQAKITGFASGANLAGGDPEASSAGIVEGKAEAGAQETVSREAGAQETGVQKIGAQKQKMGALATGAAADATRSLDAGSRWASDGLTTQRLSQVTGLSNEMPLFSAEVPRVKDDLTLLDGIGAIQADELHRMGIHNFDQLHDLSDDDRHRLKAWFRRRGWYLDMDQWRIASEGNTLNPTLEDIQRKAFEVYQYRDREGRHGAENTDWEQAEWALRGNPIFDYGVPHHVDYFVETTVGITPAACDELYRMGLYNTQQIQELDLDSRRLLTRWFAGPRFKVDLTAAFGWLSSLETVPQDKDYGFVFQQRPEMINDLSEINGIGPATERDLNRIGIYHFNQIAHWSPSNVEAVSETLNLADRIEKDLWVVQAQRLVNDT